MNGNSNIGLQNKILQLLQKYDFSNCIKNNFGKESYDIIEKEIYDFTVSQNNLNIEEVHYQIVSIIKNWLGKSQLSSLQIEKISCFCEELVGYKNNHLQNLIHETFVKYDLLGVIEKGFGDDEYLSEEGKLYSYLKEKTNSSELDIFNELVIIIEEWFGQSPLQDSILKELKLMSKDIHELM